MDFPTNEPCRVLVVCEDAFARRGFASTIQQCPQFVTCGQAATYEAALNQLEELQPDLTILDLSVRNGLGLRLVSQLKQRRPTMLLVVTSMFEDAFYAGQVLAAGAEMYLNKRAHADDFVDALQRVVRGEMYVSADIAQQLLYRATGKPNGKPSSLISALTERELQVFELLGQGLNTKKIAKQMGISPHTVETYRERIRFKIDAKDGADLSFRAISWALLNG